MFVTHLQTIIKMFVRLMLWNKCTKCDVSANYKISSSC